MANSAIRLRGMLDFESESGEKRIAGDEWLFEGPGNLICVTWTKVNKVNTVEALISGHPRGAKNVSLTGAGCL